MKTNALSSEISKTVREKGIFFLVFFRNCGIIAPKRRIREPQAGAPPGLEERGGTGSIYDTMMPRFMVSKQ